MVGLWATENPALKGIFMSAKNARFYLLIALGLVIGIVAGACTTGAKQITGYDDLTLQISTNRTRANAGDQVQIHFTATNNGKQTVQISSEGRPVLDVQVVDVNSHAVLLSWVALHPDQAARELTWLPGETKAIDAVWIPTQVGFYDGRSVFLSGFLSKDSKLAQDVSILICLGACDR